MLSKLGRGNIHLKVTRFLFSNHTPSSVTRITLAEHFYQRKLKTALDFMFPIVYLSYRYTNQAIQLEMREHSYPSIYSKSIYSKIWVKNFRSGPKWKAEIVLQRLGSVTYRLSRKERFTNGISIKFEEKLSKKQSLPFFPSPLPPLQHDILMNRALSETSTRLQSMRKTAQSLSSGRLQQENIVYSVIWKITSSTGRGGIAY